MLNDIEDIHLDYDVPKNRAPNYKLKHKLRHQKAISNKIEQDGLEQDFYVNSNLSPGS